MLTVTLSSGAEKSNVMTSPYWPDGVEEFGIVGLIESCLAIDLEVKVIDGDGYTEGTRGGDGGEGIDFLGPFSVSGAGWPRIQSSDRARPR